MLHPCRDDAQVTGQDQPHSASRAMHKEAPLSESVQVWNVHGCHCRQRIMVIFRRWEDTIQNRVAAARWVLLITAGNNSFTCTA